VSVLTPEQLTFDKDFLEKHPVLEGLTEANSIGEDVLTVLFDGKKLKMIGRHLWTRYDITMDDYRRIYKLDAKYPSCAPGYRGERRGHAKRQGLGTAKVPKTPKTAQDHAEVVSISPTREAAVA
jgi:predicted transcriptional regulator